MYYFNTYRNQNIQNSFLCVIRNFIKACREIGNNMNDVMVLSVELMDNNFETHT